MEARDLARQLRSDRAARAGHQDHLARDIRRRDRDVECDWLATEQVLDPHLPHQPEVDLFGDQILERREDLELHAGFAAAGDELARLLHGRGRNGDDEQGGLMHRGEAPQFIGAADYGDAMQRSPVFHGVVVDQAGHLDLVPWIVQQLAHQLLAGFTGSNDQCPRLRGGEPARPLAHHPGSEPRPAGEHDQGGPVEDRDDRREALQPPQQSEDADESQRPESDGCHQMQQVTGADMPPVAAKQAEAVEQNEADRQQVRQRFEPASQMFGRNAEVKA